MANLFPCTMDGKPYSLPALCKATGLTKYDITRALRTDPSLNTLTALREAVRAYKSRPSPCAHRPNRASLLWNGAHRKAANKASTKSTKSHG